MITPQPEIEAQMRLHDLRDPNYVHTNLDVYHCSCRPQVAHLSASVPLKVFSADSGEVCFICGGLMLWSGSCKTCGSCGATTGCG